MLVQEFLLGVCCPFSLGARVNTAEADQSPTHCPKCCEQGISPSHSHTFVTFHNARFIRGDLPNKPIDSYAAYTQRGGAYMIEASRESIRCKVLVTGGVQIWRGGCWCHTRWLQWWHVSCGVEVQHGSEA